MTKTEVLTRALLDHCIMTGGLDLGVWADFKTAHSVEPHQVEPVLIEAIGRLCTLSHAGRLSCPGMPPLKRVVF